MTTLIYAGAAHWTAAADSRHTGGIFRRAIGDDRWERLGGGLPDDVEVRAIAVHAREPRVIYAGTQYGPYRSADGGDTWKAIGFPDTGMVVWSFLFHPSNPEMLYAGTAPAAGEFDFDPSVLDQLFVGLAPAEQSLAVSLFSSTQDPPHKQSPASPTAAWP